MFFLFFTTLARNNAFHDLICCSEHFHFYREDFPVITFRPRTRQLFQYRHYRFRSFWL